MKPHPPPPDTNPDILTVAVLDGAGRPYPSVPEVWGRLPQVQVLAPPAGLEEFLRQSPDTAPDLVLVCLEGEPTPPDWLGEVTLHLPHTALFVCSPRKEPDYLIRTMQLGAREFFPWPLIPTEVTAALTRLRAVRQRLKTGPRPGGQVLVVTGNKGGAGVTTVAVNLALALAETQGERLALVDLGRPFPDIGNFLDLSSPYSLMDLVQNLHNLDRAFVEKIMQPYGDQLAIFHGIADFHDQDALSQEFLEQLFATLRRLYPWVVVDLGHWVDALFLQVLGEADLTLMLMELTIPDLRNLSRLWPLLREEQPAPDRLKVVINRYHQKNGLGLSSLEEMLQVSPFFALPSDYPALSEAVNQGLPLTKSAPRSRLGKSLQELAGRLRQAVPGAGGVPGALGSNNGKRARRRFWFF